MRHSAFLCGLCVKVKNARKRIVKTRYWGVDKSSFKAGPGLLESVYTECISFKLIEAGLRIQKQKPIPLVFEEVKLECGFRCDILVEDKLIIEIKQ